MPRERRTSGPIEGHWTTTLKLVESIDNGKAFIYSLCTSAGVTTRRATIQCSQSASNLYSHFKYKHSDVHAVITPIIQSRYNNIRARTQCTTITQVVANSRKLLVVKAFLCLFASPDLPKNLLENRRFCCLVHAICPYVAVLTRKTLNSLLWDYFN